MALPAGLAAFLLCAADAPGAENWHVPTAPLRFRLTLKRPPSHADGGCIATLPDGGVLPRPGPGTVAVDGDGNPLRHGVLWHDPDRGMVVVVQAPERGKAALLYAARAARVSAWRESSGLLPGLLAYTANGPDAESIVRRIPTRFPPGPGTFFSRLSVPGLGGNPTARPGPYATYLLGWLVPPQPGRTWIAPMGRVNLRVAGKDVHPRKASDRPGGTGEELLLPDAPRRLDAFHFSTGRGEKMLVAWRPPDTPASELGGEKNGQPQWDARPVRKEECVLSGDMTVSAIEARDGSPVAAIEAAPLEYVLLTEQPVVLFRFRPAARNNPRDTRYTWSFDGGTATDGEVAWLMEGGAPRTAGLTAQSPRQGSARARIALDVHCPGRNKSRLSRSETRERYGAAFLTMLQGYPADEDPTAAWGPALWDLFLRLPEPGENEALVRYLCEERWGVFSARLPVPARERLIDSYLPFAAESDPRQALAWLNERLRGEDEPARGYRWRLYRIELLMYYLDELEPAAREAAAIAATASPLAARAQIRRGDIALLKGSFDEALAFYGSVQNRVRHAREPTAEAGDRSEPIPTGLARTKQELDRQRAARRGLGRREAEPEPLPEQPVQDWRIGAVRSTAASERVRNLIGQGHYGEALEALSEWETEFPMSKLEGDFLVVEANLRIRLRQYGRAGRILDAYCSGMEMSNYMPEAMRLKLKAMIETGAEARALDAFVQDMRKRFPDHPLAERAAAMLKDPARKNSPRP